MPSRQRVAGRAVRTVGAAEPVRSNRDRGIRAVTVQQQLPMLWRHSATSADFALAGLITVQARC